MPEDPEAPYLGVERSVTGKRWQARLKDERLATAIAQRFELHEVVARVLAARDVQLDDVHSFLNPTLKSMLPDPAHLLDMQPAVDRITRAINDGETIGVLGDYDVDGATSSSLLVRFFASLGLSVPVYIPDRQKEGYGPNLPALLKLKEQGASIVITVDCGTTAYEPLEAAADAGLEVIVVDHHVAEPRLPAGALVINPNRADEASDCGQLAAVGVTFLLLVAVNRALREAFWYGEGHPEPNLLSLLDLVALGTICDVVPLTGVNRAFVSQGLKVLANRGNPGVAALAEVANVDKRLDAYHAGFVLGPRVNAGGRVGDSGLGVRLLTTQDTNEAKAVAQMLDGYNTERREIEQAVLDAAITQAEDQARQDKPLILVAANGWHPGVIGIVAGRLRERFDKPSCVVALSEGIGKGSGRSIKGVALGPAIIAAHQAGILVNGGGHNMAGGFTVEQDKLQELDTYLSEHISRQIDGTELTPTLSLDGALSPSGASPEIVEMLEEAGPFGSGNPRPRFAIPQAHIVDSGIVGKDHVRCVLTGADGTGRLKAIAFRSADTALGQAILDARGLPLHIAGNLRLDEWQGRVSGQLFIDDAAAT
ncbi:MAG: single-stranded-DNA-specific exonuclease RecJ [Rhodospirillaceae bacterium]|nr:single-stranded-DNA-specific exonuclease RecJ [Rhodospirillaceae bacterium]|tara:strand:- start:22416 stop:24200 length:1785 start_codon:yes stop_codon:yes gene_type:complete